MAVGGHAGTDRVAAGNAKVSLAADADVSARSGSVQPDAVNHLQTETDSTDGPLVVGMSVCMDCHMLASSTQAIPLSGVSNAAPGSTLVSRIHVKAPLLVPRSHTYCVMRCMWAPPVSSVCMQLWHHL